MSWRRATLRNARVLARCDAEGALAIEKGRVEIRYRPADRRAYRALPRNLVLDPDGEVLPDETCVSVVEQALKGGKSRSERSEARAASVAGADRKGRGAGRRTSGASENESRPAKKPDLGRQGGAINIYTDGACAGNPGPAGLGVVMKDGSGTRELSIYLGQGTNNVAELSAIRYAAEAVAGTSRPVRIYTDSQYSIGILTRGWKAKANTELVAAVKRTLADLPNVRLVYVPGHAGHKGNERADRLARQAIADRCSRGWALR